MPQVNRRCACDPKEMSLVYRMCASGFDVHVLFPEGTATLLRAYQLPAQCFVPMGRLRLQSVLLIEPVAESFICCGALEVI